MIGFLLFLYVLGVGFMLILISEARDYLDTKVKNDNIKNIIMLLSIPTSWLGVIIWVTTLLILLPLGAIKE